MFYLRFAKKMGGGGLLKPPFRNSNVSAGNINRNVEKLCSRATGWSGLLKKTWLVS